MIQTTTETQDLFLVFILQRFVAQALFHVLSLLLLCLFKGFSSFFVGFLEF